MTETKGILPAAWINKDGTYVELSTKSTVYGSHTIPLYAFPQHAPDVAEMQARIAELQDVVNRVARLNPNAGEIGAGMLADLVERARAAQ